jgi:transcription-repair coupling factor (superfamily II helicase)
VSQVVSPGEYAVRGGLIDLFPMGSPVPYRVDLFDDEIDSIRTFDPDSQRSLYPVPEVRCCPGASSRWTRRRASAFASAGARSSRATRPRAASTRTSARASPPPASSTTCRCSSTRRPALRLPGAQASLVLHGEVDEALQRFWTDTRERHRFLQHDPERPILPPEACS